MSAPHGVGRVSSNLSVVAAVSGPVVLAGYVVGAASTARWRRPPADEAPQPVGDAAAEAFVVVAAATAAWWLVREVSPGSNFSRIGYYSNQVLAAWHSVALWTGLAAVAGCCAPVFRRFRGSSGLAGAGALLAVHFPWFFGAAALGALAGWVATQSVRLSRLGAIAVVLPTAWLGWVLEWHPAWGLPPGPEATVWAMVLSLVLGVRWWTTPADAPGDS